MLSTDDTMLGEVNTLLGLWQKEMERTSDYLGGARLDSAWDLMGHEHLELGCFYCGVRTNSAAFRIVLERKRCLCVGRNAGRMIFLEGNPAQMRM